MTDTWTQAMCDACWTKEQPFRTPVRVRDCSERCSFCGCPTTSGIYVRRDPKGLGGFDMLPVRFPRKPRA